AVFKVGVLRKDCKTVFVVWAPKKNISLVLNACPSSMPPSITFTANGAVIKGSPLVPQIMLSQLPVKAVLITYLYKTPGFQGFCGIKLTSKPSSTNTPSIFSPVASSNTSKAPSPTVTGFENVKIKGRLLGTCCGRIFTLDKSPATSPLQWPTFAEPTPCSHCTAQGYPG